VPAGGKEVDKGWFKKKGSCKIGETCKQKEGEETFSNAHESGKSIQKAAELWGRGKTK